MSLLEKQGSPRTDRSTCIDILNGNKSDIDKLIMNYLVEGGFEEAAKKFQEETGIAAQTDWSILKYRMQIREAVETGRITDAIVLVNQIHPELLDDDRYLYFRLLQQHLIELIRNGKVTEALTFAQVQLSEAVETNPKVLCEIERTLALLAFDEPHLSPFGDLLTPLQRQKVANELISAMMRIHRQEPSKPSLVNIPKVVLWAQNELDKKKVPYSKMVDFATGKIEKLDELEEKRTRGRKRYRSDRVCDVVPYNVIRPVHQ